MNEFYMNQLQLLATFFSECDILWTEGHTSHSVHHQLLHLSRKSKGSEERKQEISTVHTMWCGIGFTLQTIVQCAKLGKRRDALYLVCVSSFVMSYLPILRSKQLFTRMRQLAPPYILFYFCAHRTSHSLKKIANRREGEPLVLKDARKLPLFCPSVTGKKKKSS